MNSSTQWAVFLALVLVAFLGFVLGKAAETDLPRCPEGAMLEGIGDWQLGRYPWYQCATTPVDQID